VLVGNNEAHTRVLPVYVAELMLPLASLQRDWNVESSTCWDSATDTRHSNDWDVVEWYITGRLRDEHKTFVETEEKTFVCFNRAFDSWLLVMADEILRGCYYLLPGQTAEDLCYHGMLGALVVWLEFAVVLFFKQFSTVRCQYQPTHKLSWMGDFANEALLGHVEVNDDLLVTFELHD